MEAEGAAATGGTTDSRATLGRLQRGLEQMYRVETELDVHDFVIDADARDRMGVQRKPREQLLLTEREGDLELGVFVCPNALDNLERHDPAHVLDERNLRDFLLALEGVSHFVYLTWRARADLAVSALELELQAEVDKYVTCLLLADACRHKSAALRRRLFIDIEFHDDLDDDERSRYRAASENARRYATSLERRFVRSRRMPGLLAELRRFYRLSLAGKLAHISRH